MSVKVAVRVRPFNPREKQLNSKLCVDMQGNSTIVEDDDGKPRTFTFDYSFWSHDEFIEEPNGYLRAEGNKYADQMSVYESVGKEVLKNAWEGYHCCLFAYGQTGSGKSYSMIGYGANKGIVPISSEQIFTRIHANTDTSVIYEVSVSMLEIYNEKIQDLLIDSSDRVKGGLKVRESKTLGVYVEGLSAYRVNNYEEIAEKMDEGSRNRSIGATEMNAHSSRAHTIITINFMQKTVQDKRTVEKISVINLVDLAGSEKASKTNATGDRLKEGSSINKSLTVLGLVISTLAEKSGGKAKGVVVPFRNSALTRILQNALGGNSKTLMICAISPASDNYEETVSTLRYADQAKKIKCNAVINESETDKLIRELKEENDKFKQLLMQLASKGEIPKGLDIASMLGNFGGPTNEKLEEEDEEVMQRARKDSDQHTLASDSTAQDEESKRVADALKEKLAQTEEQLRAHMMMMEEYEKTFKEGMVETKAVSPTEKKEKFDLNFPHISNVNEDPMLTGKVLHSFKHKRIIRVGRKGGEGIDIKLGAMGIHLEHAVLEYEEDDGVGAVYLSPADDTVRTGLYLNGERVEEKERLFHLDRIIFGTGTVFLFKDYENVDFKRTDLEEKDIDLEFCQTEMSQKTQQVDDLVKNVEEEITNAKLEETEKQLREQEEAINQYKMKLENIEMDGLRQEKDLEFRQLQADFDRKKLERDIEFEKHKQMLKEKHITDMKLEKEKKVLEQNLAKYVPMIIESNLIARELKREVSFSPYLAYHFSDIHDVNDDSKEEGSRHLTMKVKVDNHEAGYFYIWNLDKFFDRYFMIKELLDDYFGSNELPDMSEEKDPFWDPPEPILLGQGFLKLLSIAYLLDSPTDLILVGDEGQTGTLSVNLVPANDQGEAIDPDYLLEEDLIEDPRELIGRRLDVIVEINEGSVINKDITDVFCSYTIVNDKQKDQFRTESVKLDNEGKFMFNFKKHHFFSQVSESLLTYLLNSNLRFEVYGNEARKQRVVKKVKKEEKPKEVEVKPEQTVTKPAPPGNFKVVDNPPPPVREDKPPVPKKQQAQANKDNKKDKDCRLI